ncbi:hypothetical protein [Streptomyces sp. Root369]|uniref:hypothetical protein n=1 Tax=Streptomyces sp. Root369 TaxID=1736523 RepID=UPI000708E5FE|nr:hypothetical protein [Streptomyces sp. Root369]KQW17667.1 hypothetical protein ASD08_01385 [Streptomyces sp. Root369]
MTDPDRSVWPLALAVRWAGRLLCWSLGAGMATAAVDLTVVPRASWWPTLWPLPWYTTAASALLWAVLRAREKYVLSGGDDDPQTDEEVYAEWDQAA